MEKLLDLRIGGGRVQPGLLPVGAGRLLEDLLDALSELGGDPHLWANANVHFGAIREGSTTMTVASEFAPFLHPAVAIFEEGARHGKLTGKGRAFVEQNFGPMAPWTYAELMPANGSGREPLRFDYAYRERILEEIAPVAVMCDDSIYGRIVRVGGDNPPTAKVELMGHGAMTLQIRGTKPRELAKFLGANLYETVLLHGVARWDKKAHLLLDFTILDIDREWQDFSFSRLIADNGGRLPVKLTVDDAAELIKEREEARGESV